MNRNAIQDQNVRGRPVWRCATDTFDDRVSEEIFDAEDERAEVDVIVNGTIHSEQRRTIWA